MTTETRSKKIGIFGGTFDPIHFGHLITAEIIYENQGFDEIWFLPAYYHVLKDKKSVSSPDYRLKMVELAIADNPNFKVLDIEIKRNRVSRTVETLSELIRLYPDYKFFFMVGIDALNQFDKWYQVDEIFRLANIITFGRPPFQLNEVGKKYLQMCDLVKTPLIEISSTDIRRRVKEGKTIRYFVPYAVEKFIHKHHLYRK
jgi:nicotinate-nucleotide adenylyltransferase